jgi:hypothetical protein
MWIMNEKGDLVNLALHEAIVKEKDGSGKQVVVRTGDGMQIACLPSEHHADELLEEIAINLMKGTACIDLFIRIKQLKREKAVRGQYRCVATGD